MKNTFLLLILLLAASLTTYSQENAFLQAAFNSKNVTEMLMEDPAFSQESLALASNQLLSKQSALTVLGKPVEFFSTREDAPGDRHLVDLEKLQLKANLGVLAFFYYQPDKKPVKVTIRMRKDGDQWQPRSFVKNVKKGGLTIDKEF